MERPADLEALSPPREPGSGRDTGRDRPSDNVPIFVVGSPRSGTTLLYHLLLTSGAFPVYMAESKIMACEEHYGSLARERNRERFLADFLASRQFARSGLEASTFADEVRQGRMDYPGVLRLLMDEVARAQSKDRWAEKTPAHLWHLDRLASRFPSARFLHIVRDGRDVAVSLRKLGWTHAFGGDPVLQLVEAGMRWEANVVEGLRASQRLPGRCIEVKYEDLVTRPEETMLTVGELVDITPNLESTKSEIADSLESANTAFSSPMQGISDAGVGRWRRRLNEEEIGALHHAVGDTLERLGYDVSRQAGDEDAGWRDRMLVRSYPVLEGARNFLKRHTPLGRMAESPLEVGLG